MPNPVITQALDALASRRDLTADQTAAVLAEVMAGNASEVETAGFLVALRTKRETIDELVGLARTMRAFATPVTLSPPTRDDLIDTAGTGGGRPTFNVSTTAAFVAAGAGCLVAKHGNRSATSRCGSADVLEALGARIDLAPQAVAECIAELGFGFMFAPNHHSAMRHVVPVRKELAVRTVFNLLGPLTNPAGAMHQVIGVADGSYLEKIAAALGELGTASALVVSSADGLDELSASGPTHVVELKGGELSAYEVSPGELGIEPAGHGAVRAGEPDHNAEVTRTVLAGHAGAERSLAVVNAGAAIYVAGAAGSLEAGVRRAEEAIDDGSAREVLERFVE